MLATTCVAFALVAPATASALDYIAHDGDSLAKAVASADDSPGPDTITLDAGTYLPSETLDVSGSLAIAGPGTSPGVKIDGSAINPYPSPVFNVAKGANLKLHAVLITTGGGSNAAAVDATGDVTLEDSALIGNIGPALLVRSGSTASVVNTTISDNLDAGVVSVGSVDLLNVTVAANARGGIADSGHGVTLTNTIVAGNTFGDCNKPARLVDHALDSDGSCGAGSLEKRDPLLAPVEANGGPTPTRALGTGSPAIGAGDGAKCPATDQRLYTRTGACDLGAYQASAVKPAPSGGGGGATRPNVKPSSSPTGSKKLRDHVRAHGRLRSRAGSKLTVHLDVMAGRTQGTFSVARGGRVIIRATSITSVTINTAMTQAAMKPTRG